MHNLPAVLTSHLDLPTRFLNNIHTHVLAIHNHVPPRGHTAQWLNSTSRESTWTRLRYDYCRQSQSEICDRPNYHSNKSFKRIWKLVKRTEHLRLISVTSSCACTQNTAIGIHLSPKVKSLQTQYREGLHPLDWKSKIARFLWLKTYLNSFLEG